MNKDDILNKQFDRAAIGGYKVDDVNTFLRSVAAELDGKNSAISELQGKLVTLAEHLEKYRNDDESMRSALLKAQKLGDSIVKDSKDKSSELMETAIQEAESLISKAKNDATVVKHEAKVQIENESIALNKMKREVAKFRNQLLSLYKQHVSMIENLPNEEVEEIQRTYGKISPNRAEAEMDSGAPPLSSPLTSNIPRVSEEESKNAVGLEKGDNFSLKHDFKPLNFGEGFKKIEEETN